MVKLYRLPNTGIFSNANLHVLMIDCNNVSNEQDIIEKHL